MNLNGAVITIFMVCGVSARLSLICFLIEDRTYLYACVKSGLYFSARKIWQLYDDVVMSCYKCYNECYKTRPKTIKIKVSSSQLGFKH